MIASMIVFGQSGAEVFEELASSSSPSNIDTGSDIRLGVEHNFALSGVQLHSICFSSVGKSCGQILEILLPPIRSK